MIGIYIRRSGKFHSMELLNFKSTLTRSLPVNDIRILILAVASPFSDKLAHSTKHEHKHTCRTREHVCPGAVENSGLNRCLSILDEVPLTSVCDVRSTASGRASGSGARKCAPITLPSHGCEHITLAGGNLASVLAVLAVESRRISTSNGAL